MEKAKKIKVKYHDKKLIPLEKIEIGDFIDLRSAEDVDLKKGEFKIISLGVSIQPPKGYYSEVVPRSSTFKKYGVLMANSVGIIDESYSGDSDIWGFPAYAVRDTHISKNDRICQFRIVKKPPKVEFEVVENMNNPSRGGYGSTGYQ